MSVIFQEYSLREKSLQIPHDSDPQIPVFGLKKNKT